LSVGVVLLAGLFVSFLVRFFSAIDQLLYADQVARGIA
jgi:hypothetical protein